MVKVQYKSNLGKLNIALEQVMGASLDLSDVLYRSVVIASKITRQNFLYKGSGPYTPLSPVYARQKRLRYGSKPILVASQRLRKSLASDSGGGTNVAQDQTDSIVKIDKMSATYGTKVPYASYVQDGTGRMPARPFLVVTEHMEKQIAATFLEDIASQIDDALSDI